MSTVRNRHLASGIALTSDGTDIHFHTAGDENQGGGTVVLVPGIGGSSSLDFAFLMPMLARRRRVIAMDFSHQDKALPIAGINDLVAQLDAVIREADPEDAFVLFGHSLGAEVSAAYAANSRAVGRLVLAAAWLNPPARLKLHCEITRRLLAEGSTALHDYLLSSNHSGAYLEELQAVASAAGRCISGTQFQVTGGLGPHFDRLLELASTLDISEVVPRIAVPTLVIGCAQDTVATETQSKLLFAALSDARYASVDTGHAIVNEMPAELFSLLERFIDDATNPADSIFRRARA